MSLMCGLGFHSWELCKCKRCGKTKNEDHDWAGCKCKRCGKTRDEGHSWQRCECVVCGAARHEGNGCKCSVCGKVKSDDHNWNGCKCRICGATRDEDHAWVDETCSVCGKVESLIGQIGSIIGHAVARSKGQEREFFQLTARMETEKAQEIFDALDPDSKARARSVIEKIGPMLARMRSRGF